MCEADENIRNDGDLAEIANAVLRADLEEDQAEADIWKQVGGHQPRSFRLRRFKRSCKLLQVE